MAIIIDGKELAKKIRANLKITSSYSIFYRGKPSH